MALIDQFKQAATIEMGVAKRNLISNINSRGFSASGDSKKMNIISNNKGVALMGVNYFDHGLVTGGKKIWPNVDNLRKWVVRKIAPPSKQVNSITFLIGRKIKEEGTNLLQGKRQSVGVEEEALKFAKALGIKTAKLGKAFTIENMKRTINKN